MKNKKAYHLFRILLLVLSTQIVLGQSEIFISFPMYLEDSIGNKDTLIIGMESRRSNEDHPKVTFGEKAITEPFDSVFEARLSNDSNKGMSSYFSSKKIILNSEGDEDWRVSSFASIFVNCKYPPVKISYDSTIFHDIRFRGSFFTPDWQVITNQYEEDAVGFQCANAQDEFVFDFSERPDVPVSAKAYFQIEGQDTVSRFWGILFKFTYFPYCEPVNTLRANKAVDLITFPNPFQDQLNIMFEGKLEDNYQAIVTSFDGRVIQSFNNLKPNIINQQFLGSMTNIPAGVYQLSLIRNNQLVGIKRIIKTKVN